MPLYAGPFLQHAVKARKERTTLLIKVSIPAATYDNTDLENHCLLLYRHHPITEIMLQLLVGIKV